MASSTPSAIISDAMSSLSHAVTLALANVEDQARLDITRTASEARQARSQRDEALNALHAVELEQSSHKQQLQGWKIAVEKADLTVKHQAETISQLRDETAHWKDQYSRMEKTCQQWKDQFSRVEQERYRLSARLEELVSNQLSRASLPERPYYNTYHSNPSGHEFVQLSTASTSTKRGSTSSDQNPSKYPAQEEEENAVPIAYSKSSKPQKAVVKANVHQNIELPKTPTSTNKHSKKALPSHPVRDKIQSRHTIEPVPSLRKNVPGESGSSRPQVIRRVQAVIEVPVKTEEEDYGQQYEQDLPEEEDKVPPPPTRKATTARNTPSSRKKGDQSKGKEREKSKSWQVWRDKKYRTPMTSDIGDVRDPEEEDEYEHDDDEPYKPPPKRRNLRRKKSARNLHEPELDESDPENTDEAEEDELTMGADDNQEVYGPRSFPPEKIKTRSTGTHNPNTTPSQPTNTKKRRISALDSNGGPTDSPKVAKRR